METNLNKQSITTIPSLSSISMSTELNNLFASLSNFQGEMEAVSKDNHGHRHRYADINAVLSEIRPLLKKHQLSIQQHPMTDESGKHRLFTILAHSSGQWISSSLVIEEKQAEDIQWFGACITYLRRYVAVSVLGIEQEDSDGNRVTSNPKENNMPKYNKTNDGISQNNQQHSSESSKELITEPQIKMLKQVIKAMGDNPEEKEKEILKHYKVDSIDKLLKNDAGSLISKLNNRMGVNSSPFKY